MRCFGIRNNVLQLPEGGDFGAIHCQPSTNLERSTKLDLTTEQPLLGGAVSPRLFYQKFPVIHCVFFPCGTQVL